MKYIVLYESNTFTGYKKKYSFPHYECIKYLLLLLGKQYCVKDNTVRIFFFLGQTRLVLNNVIETSSAR